MKNIEVENLVTHSLSGLVPADHSTVLVPQNQVAKLCHKSQK